MDFDYLHPRNYDYLLSLNAYTNSKKFNYTFLSNKVASWSGFPTEECYSHISVLHFTKICPLFSSLIVMAQTPPVLFLSMSRHHDGNFEFCFILANISLSKKTRLLV